MSYFDKLPIDIKYNVILKYIDSEHFDKFTSIDNNIVEWFNNKINIEFYLKLKGKSHIINNYDARKGLLWSSKHP